MAISQINKVWETEAIKEPRMVLLALALADWSNEEGWCWPSMRSLAVRARVSESTARRMLKRLVTRGVLQVEENRGRGNTNRYRLILDIKPVNMCEVLEEENLSFLTLKPVILSTKPVKTNVKPVIAVTPEPKNQIQPKENHQDFSIPDWIPIQLWDEWYTWRKKLKLPIGKNAQKIHVHKLEEYRARGHPPEEILSAAIERGWKGLFIPENGRNGSANQKPSYIEERVNSTFRKLQDTAEANGGISKPAVEPRRG